MKRLSVFAFAALVAVAPEAAFAWGDSGHRMIGEAAVKALPGALPAFLRTPQAALDVGEYSREPDRVKGAGKAYDIAYSPGHFVDVGDDGRILGGPSLAALPPTREDYDSALRVVGQDSWKAGWLPYSIIESYQALSRDFAFWRVLKAAEANPSWKAHRAWFAADRRRREVQILQAAGTLSHYVGDGSQPLHVTVHFNGWGDYPNPAGYSNARLHAPFESELVRASVSQAAVKARLAPFHSCGCAVEQRVGAYLTATGKLVVPFYELEKAGGLSQGDRRGPAFAAEQIAVAASELRDLMVEAWRDSGRASVGWEPVSVADVEAGRVDPYPALYGVD